MEMAVALRSREQVQPRQLLPAVCRNEAQHSTGYLAPPRQARGQRILGPLFEAESPHGDDEKDGTIGEKDGGWQ